MRRSSTKTPEEYKKEGASRSLAVTIRDLDRILKGQAIQIKGRLRPKLYEKIEDLAEHWYRRGFNRGITTLKETNPKAVSKLLPVTAKRRVPFLGKSAGLNRERKIILRSTGPIGTLPLTSSSASSSPLERRALRRRSRQPSPL